MELPLSFINYTKTLLGADEYQRLSTALEEEQPVSIRLNKKKAELLFPSIRTSCSQVPWCDNGFYLDHRLTFTFDPLFHAGCYYVQEASSMFVGYALQQYIGKQQITLLDLCAAPGGKSTLVRDLLSADSLLIANEVVRSRAYVLAENLIKWGNANVVVTNNNPIDFSKLPDFFDVILADVPCSGEGMFRKDQVAISEWSSENVENCWQRQRRIIEDIWPSLKPGGLLFYSTCTYNTKENEENIQWICRELGAEVLPVDILAEWQVTGNLLAGTHFPVYRFFPYLTKGEGFFLAVLRKVAETDRSDAMQHEGREAKNNEKEGDKSNNYLNTSRSNPGKGKSFRTAETRQSKNALPTINKEQWGIVKSWINSPDDYEWLVLDNSIRAFPKANMERFGALRACMHLVHSGIAVAECKGKDVIPSHALAMSTALNPQAFICTEITYAQAISFLRKEAIVLPSDIPLGYILLTYRTRPIGFVKNIGNRANNLYPQEWKIKSGYLPDNLRIIEDV